MTTSAERLQPYIVAEARRARGMAADPLTGDEAFKDADLLAYAKSQVAELRAPATGGRRRVLAEHDHESKTRCEAIERLIAQWEQANT